MKNELPMPPPIQVPGEIRMEDIEDAALELYERVGGAERRAAEAQQRLRTEMAEKESTSHRLIAMLAAERFEFDRLMSRLAPELERRNAADLLQLLNLYARAWDLKLSRASLQIIDLAGYPLTDDLAGEVEVESHVPDPSVAVTVVRETLVPHIVLEGKTIGLARIITAVPVTTEEVL